MKKSGLTSELFEVTLISIFSAISFIPDSKLIPFGRAADNICPDPNDVEFFALCLAKKLPLWSNDKELKKQSAVKVLNTQEVMELVKLT